MPFWSRLGLPGAQPPAPAAETRAPETKDSATRRILLALSGQAVWTPRETVALTREGFGRNPVAYRAVRMVAEAAASVPWLLYEGRRERDTHPLLALLARPNPRQSGPELMEAWYGHLLCAGNAYAEAVTAGNAVRELHILRPDRMKILPGGNGWPEGFEYSAGGRSVRFAAGKPGALPPVLHMALFHPLDDHYGQSPLEAAATAIDIHNAGARWSKALLDNAARPSGALVYTGPEGAPHLTQDQFDRLKGELEESFSGSANAGRPLLLEGGLDWRPISLSPGEMDFQGLRHGAAREIALAFGVPPMLLGIPGDNTYATFREANLAFWRQTVLPLAQKTAQAFTNWLGPRFGEELRLGLDLDQVEALSDEREALWARVGAAAFLTEDEKRMAVGYGVKAGAP